MLPVVMRYWLPPAVWTAVILLASSDLFASDRTGSLLATLLAGLLGEPLLDDTFAVAHFLVRKLAHLVEYAILGALLFRALRAGRTGWRASWAAGAVAIALGVAATDELLQSLSPLRTGTPSDVVIDLAGAAVAQMLLKARNAPRPAVLSSDR